MLSRLYTGLATLTILTLASSSALAKSQPSVPDAIQAQMDQYGLTVHSTFDAPGVTGYVFDDPSSNRFTAFIPHDSNVIIMGEMLDENFESLTDQVLAKIAYQALDANPDFWFARGNPDAPYVYVIDDPMCPYCHEQHNVYEEAVSDGLLQTRHVIVGILGERSMQAAGGILDSEDPATAYEAHHLNFTDSPFVNFEGETESPTIQDRNQFMSSLGIAATPATIYKKSNGQSAMTVGLISDAQSLLDKL